ncbi:MAG TPA: protein kinase [Thermoanaerobaculia bacterium]|nr:protein kinase [Thermoanaerobaculia bacterium]
MSLSAGTKLGPYEIVAPLGAGGMGEVYRARDERLGRDVAIKVLPAELAENAERLKRFEKEARSASALNHHNIVTVFDIGSTDGVSWMAMERVDGETLRKLLAPGPLPLKKLLAIGAQVADGLAKAHGQGIVHRDLKPENVMVTKDGVAKILDFGLAKLTAPAEESGELTQSPTMTAATEAGVVLGTVGYMSPEQALGQALDFRSDQFAFGAMLYEMLTGRRAFARPSAPETMTAIIREEPEPLATAAPDSPVPLRWVIERCLAKDREERYAATKDLARDLARLREGLTEGSLSGAVLPVAAARPSVKRRLAAAAGAALAAGALLGVFLFRRGPSGPPTYRPLSFHRGAIGNARFGTDGKTILYSAAWEGKPAQIYSTRVDSPESTALPLPSADLLSISSTGRLAILVLHGDTAAIAEVALAGGAPRELVAADPPDALQFSSQVADYAPGEDRLAIVRNGGLEFPIGKVLVPATSDAHVVALRFLPDGKRIAYTLAVGEGGQAIGITDLEGKARVLTTGWETICSIAWNAVAKEIWFSGRQKDNHIGVVELHAVSLSGRERLVAQNPQLIIVEDVAPDGRVLARSDDWPETVMCLAPGASREQELTWFDFSEGVALSDDGRDLLLVEGGAGAGAKGGTYLRKTDGSSAAVRLSDGWIRRQALSPDRKVVAQIIDGAVQLVPVGAGESKTIRDKDVEYIRPIWFPDGKKLLLTGARPGGGPRMWVRDLEAGPPRPVTPEGVAAGKLSPDGKLVAAAVMKTDQWALYPVDGGDPRPIASPLQGDVLGFDDKGLGLNVSTGGLNRRIERLDLSTGRRSFVREIAPADPTGVAEISSIQLTPDGKSYCYSFMRALSRLYAVDGLR